MIGSGNRNIFSWKKYMQNLETNYVTSKNERGEKSKASQSVRMLSQDITENPHTPA